MARLSPWDEPVAHAAPGEHRIVVSGPGPGGQSLESTATLTVSPATTSTIAPPGGSERIADGAVARTGGAIGSLLLLGVLAGLVGNVVRRSGSRTDGAT